MQPPSSTAKQKAEDPPDESEELKRFREEWKSEVKRRKQQVNISTDVSSDIKSLESESTNVQPVPAIPFSKTAFDTGSSNSAASASSARSAKAPPASVHVTTAPALSQGSNEAVAIYRQAVVHEQRGELEEALYLYRSAFRREPNVDKLYEREEMLGAILAQQIASISSPNKDETFDPSFHRPKVVLAGNGFTMEDLSKQMEKTLAVQELKSAEPRTEHGVIASRSLDSLLNNFPNKLLFEPEDEGEPVPFNILPDEMIVHVLKILDPTSLERFASVNRKARVISLDVSIWRKLVNQTYKPPQIPVLPDGQSFLEYLCEQYVYDYRKLYIEHPRIRTDGVYISVCHYIRQGLSENSWVNVNHLITYHRYLRFFPNGQVISLLTNEEQPPAQVIPLLKPTLRGVKGLFFGNWHLSGNTVVLSNLIDASSRALTSLDFSSPSSVAELLRPKTAPPTTSSSGGGWGPSSSSHTGHGHGHGHGHSSTSDVLPTIRYIFTMNLSLVSRPLGRWNKMDMVSYDSVNLETGDASPVALKHERPFWFSKVRSYAV